MKNAMLLISLLGCLQIPVQASVAPESMRSGNSQEDVSLGPVPTAGTPYFPSRASEGIYFPREIIANLTNFPNPADIRKPGALGQTVISYDLVEDAKVEMTLYTLLGASVRSWSFSAGEPGAQRGTNHVAWDGTNETGRKVAKGGYIAQIVVETATTTVTVTRKIGIIH